MAERSAHSVRMVAVAWLAALVWTAGCASPLPAARRSFYAGDLEKADAELSRARMSERDRVLLLMERGAVRQAMGRYGQSSRDFIDAADLIEEMETRSLAHGVAGTVTDDRALRFRGAPYERTWLHSLTALNHLATGDWDHAAVESRRMLRTLDPDRLKGYPQDAGSRYLAGLGFQMIDDGSNAALQFRHADDLTDAVDIHENGRLGDDPDAGGAELIVVILQGRSPSGQNMQYRWTVPDRSPSVEVFAGEDKLGSAHVLTDTAHLAFATAEREAARRTARALARIAAKETLARTLDREDGLLGFLFRVILIDIFEQPDTRRWETLPRWVHVARVPFPPESDALRLVVSHPGGGRREVTVDGPFPQRRSTRFALVRLP